MSRVRRVYRCGWCLKQFKRGEDRVHSDWSGLSYCTDFEACRRRGRHVTPEQRPEIVWRAPIAR